MATTATTTQLKLKGIDHINFACADLERTIAFWRSIGVERAFDLVLHDPGVKTLHRAIDGRTVQIEPAVAHAAKARHQTAHPGH